MFVKEAFQKLYNGEDVFSKHLSLFSLCGIIGLYDAYVLNSGINSVGLYEKIGYAIVWTLYSIYFVGYETIFLHERSIPEVDLNPLKIVFNKPLLFVVGISILLLTAKFLPQYLGLAFLLELLLAVPLTAIQAGYSYNYNTDDILPFVKSLSMRNYLSLLMKRILFFICAYLFVSTVIFVLFFVFGFIIGFGGVTLHLFEVSDVSLMMSSIQSVITKLSNYISGILFVYVLTICCLVWDYELIKEKDNENIRNNF